MAFQGSLDDLSLPDIIQLLAGASKTGLLRITSGERIGDLHVARGRIVHAETARLRGEEAVYDIATWRRGTFRFRDDVPCPERTIEHGNDYLMMEAARRLDEWYRLAERIPSLDEVPVLVEEAPGACVHLRAGQFHVVRRIDGQRTVRELAADGGLEDFETCQILHSLLEAGLVRLRRDPPRKASSERISGCDTSAA